MSEKRWIIPIPNPQSVADIQAEVGCPGPIARLLATRNIADPRRFLNPTLDDLHSPELMLGMAVAVARIQRAVALGEPILIYGDYDVDGTTATVLLKTAIERIALPGKPAQVSYHVPHRLREGYGIQNVRLAEAAEAGIRLVISVDTGIRAFEAAAEAKALGLDLIVTDHHLPDGVEGVPEALAVVNPAQRGCEYPNKNLCGAGVAFKLAHALLAAHATSEAQQKRLREAILPSFLKLVAIATVADSVSLTGENRAIVWLGLRELANPVQPGLRALMQVAKLPLDQAPTATEVGFRIAPRINAAGRMDIASDVVELFLTRDPDRAEALAQKLDALNQDRRASEAAALEAIELQLMTLRDSSGEYPFECIVLDHPEWHRGVIGILASRVVDRTRRPALVLTSENGHAHGSGRSVEGFHLLDALTAVNAGDADPLFTRFGGHAHAVGFSLPTDRLAELRRRMQMHSGSLLTGEMLEQQIYCDLELEAADLTLDLLHWINRCAPFGMGNPEPVFVTRGLRVSAAPRVIKERHICLPLGTSADGKPLSAMGWSRNGQTSWADRSFQVNVTCNSDVDIVYRLRENRHPTFGGLELEMIDLCLTKG
jgi:single-stranded-DNA-specific exonuclease